MRFFRRTKIDVKIRLRIRHKEGWRRSRRKYHTQPELDSMSNTWSTAKGVRQLQLRHRMESLATAVCTALIAHIFLAWLHLYLS